MTGLLDLQRMDVTASFSANADMSPFGSCVFNSCNVPTKTGN
ncbi:hypothetical protein [Sporosarcina limicola]|uniref:Uncharacterized protein n=1 Tax=Sporosarcina limicola TaxID=34101 RepID=A0A927MKL0_9BACL|nr:hypothetical protein [Sporosarcina limicola]MBE1555606.1 hypothetical protein [Sporosarcina limicola]